MFKKLLASILISLTLLVSFVPKVNAQATWYDQSPVDWFTKVYDPTNPQEIFGERYTAAQVQWIIYSLFSFLIPDKPLVQCMLAGNITDCLNQLKTQLHITDADLNKNVATKKESLLSLVFASDRPISFISYAKGVSEKFTLVSTVHAQTAGFGFQALSVIQTLWTASRNIVYGLFVIIAVVLAFMIMFRVKISPQVVISVQSAIPKLVIALILVTFSYAIAGLLIDLMYVVIGILSVALAGVGASSNGIFATDSATIFKFLTTGYVGINSTLGASIGIFGDMLIYVLVFSIMVFAAMFVVGGGVVGAVATLGIIPVFAALLGLIVFIIMLIVVLIAGFKTLWMLFKAFGQILLLTIAAPFQIAFGAVVQNAGFSSWLKSFVSNLIIFPVTGLFLALSFVFLLFAGNVLGSQMLTLNWWQLIGIIIPGGVALGNTIANNSGWPPLLGVNRKGKS